MEQLIFARKQSDTLTCNPYAVSSVCAAPKRRSRLWRLSLVALAASVLPLASASAERVKIGHMEYFNHGTYNAYFHVGYEINGKSCRVYRKNRSRTSSSNKRIVYDLDDDFKVNWGTKNCLINGKIPNNTRVWGYIVIEGGNKNTCQKDKVLIYDKDSTAVQKYKSSGTTLNNNSCKHN